MFSKNSVVLIVDDSLATRTQMRADLKHLGYINVVEADNGKKGLQQIESAEKLGAPVTLVISDWNMPEMTGLEFLNNIRLTEHLTHLPFIMLTSNTDINEVIKAVNAGVNSYLLKPYDINGLKESIEMVFKRQKLKF